MAETPSIRHGLAGFGRSIDPTPSTSELFSGNAASLPDGPRVTTPRPLLDRKTVLISGGFLLIVPVVGYFSWWKSGARRDFSFNSEGWLGEDTYAGGADKVSHFFFGYLIFNGLESLYTSLGHSPKNSRGLAATVLMAASLIVETGDGYRLAGFAWEDVATASMGNLLAWELMRRGWDDTIGLRYGYVPARFELVNQGTAPISLDYSREIYSADVKLAGLLPRLRAKPDWGRFLLVSVTYATKGYEYASISPELRRRDLGLELGLNLPEILRALKVNDRSWWGKPLFTFLKYFRVPYTAFGYRYDLNRGRWHGPDTGER